MNTVAIEIMKPRGVMRSREPDHAAIVSPSKDVGLVSSAVANLHLMPWGVVRPRELGHRVVDALRMNAEFVYSNAVATQRVKPSASLRLHGLGQDSVCRAHL